MLRTIEYDDLVRRVYVETLAEWECDRVVVERRVRRRVVCRDGCLCEPRDELLDVPDALHTRDRRAEGRVVPAIA